MVNNKALLIQARDALEGVLKAHRVHESRGLPDTHAEAERIRNAIIYAVLDAEKAIAALTAAIDAPESEPVAWIVEFENGERELHWNDTKESLGETQTPLYLHPPAPRQPLTNDQITAIYGGASPMVYEIIRAIEAAHGIGAKP